MEDLDLKRSMFLADDLIEKQRRAQKFLELYRKCGFTDTEALEYELFLTAIATRDEGREEVDRLWRQICELVDKLEGIGTGEGR